MSTKIVDETIENSTPAGDRQIVALHLGNEVYGIDIAIIHTVITPQAITSVPKTPKFVKGVMNLRGRILPVIDLRTRFEMGELAEDKKAGVRIVIVDTEGLTAGLIVDGVSEVLRLPVNQIEPPSGLISCKGGEFLTGIGRMTAKPGEKEQLILLMDATKALTATVQGLDKLKNLQKAA